MSIKVDVVVVGMESMDERDWRRENSTRSDNVLYKVGHHTQIKIKIKTKSDVVASSDWSS